MHGWLPAAQAGFEVVIFIHGWSSSVTNGAKVIGQLFAMGSFPAHVKPIVYGWPTGPQTTFAAGAKSAQNKDVHCDFAAFVDGLRLQGVAQIHVVAHSMGARMFSHAIHLLKESVAPAEETRTRRFQHRPRDESTVQLPLGSIILLHPEADLNKFIAEDFAVMRRLCPNICLYSDVNDMALLASKLVYGSVFLQKVTAGGLKLGDSNPYQDFRSLGLSPEALKAADSGAPLDMDVIDISWMEHNVADRHNYFTKCTHTHTLMRIHICSCLLARLLLLLHLHGVSGSAMSTQSLRRWASLAARSPNCVRRNFWMVSDIREIIVLGKRARLRVQRLVQRPPQSDRPSG